MRLRISINELHDRLIEKFYPIVMILYIVAVMVPHVSVATIAGALLLSIGILSLFAYKGVIKKDVVYLYFAILVGSGILYLFNDMPIDLYFTGLVYCALPVIMYFIPQKNTELILSKMFWAILFSLIIGFILYLWGPSFYGEYLVNHDYIMRASQVSYSLQGLYGITAVGTYSACATIFFYGKWLQTGKKALFISTVFSLLILFISMRRSAVVSCIILFVVENVVFFIKFKKNQGKQLVVTTVIFLLLIAAFLFESTELSTAVSRLFGVSEAISERSGNWNVNIASFMDNPLWGKGLGACGHTASAAGYTGVHDNSYLMILCENGIIGFVCFILVLLIAIKSFFIRIVKTETDYIAFFIVLIFMIQAIGSNVWEFPISAVLFWFSLSICKNGVKKACY